MRGRRWTEEEDARIRELAAQRLSWQAIADDLGVSKSGVEAHARRIGVTKPSSVAWTDEDDERLRELWGSRSREACATELGRSRRAVEEHALLLGLTRPRDEWDEVDIERLRQMWPACELRDIADQCHHGEEPCRRMAARLGLVRDPGAPPLRSRNGPRRARTEGAPTGTAPPAPRSGAAWDWKEGRYVWRHRDEPVPAIAAELGRTEDEVSEIVAALEEGAAERRGEAC